MPSVVAGGATGTGDTKPQQPPLQRLVKCLEEIQTKVDNQGDGLQFLKNIFQDRRFQMLLKAHDNLVTSERYDHKPTIKKSAPVAEELCASIERSNTNNLQAIELYQILSEPHIKALLSAHDQVANKEFIPKLPLFLNDAHSKEKSVKIVRLVKSSGPLGATIRQDEYTGNIMIARILKGGPADRSGLLRIGDEIQEVNGIDVRGKSPDDVVRLLNGVKGSIIFKVLPVGGDNKHWREPKIHLRAHFDYNAVKDGLLPCREAGLSFKKGEILHVVSQDDNSWWQAWKEGDVSKGFKAGLIPSKTLQERRLLIQKLAADGLNCINGDVNQEPVFNKKTAIITRDSFHRKKRPTSFIYRAKDRDGLYDESIATYEEIEQLSPESKGYFTRPVVLIGPEGVGCNEIKNNLLEKHKDKFDTAMVYTTGTLKSSDRDSVFVAREVVDNEKERSGFIRLDQQKGGICGIAVSSIKAVVNTGKTCLLTCQAESLRDLRIKELMPFIVFVKPPSLEKLKSTRILTPGESKQTDEDFKTMIQESEVMTAKYSHYFDLEIINDDLETACEQVVGSVKKLSEKIQWVPAEWVR